MKNLDEVILEMTQKIEEDSIEWIFQAIDKVIDFEPKLYPLTHKRLDEVYGKEHSRDKVYATTYIKNQIIEEHIGGNVYSCGLYFIQRGVRRGQREEIVINDVAKDFKAKRENLKNKILKLANGDEIIEISNVSTECGKLGCFAHLSNGDRIEIYTIFAGGWNIQKFHFRGLAKRIIKK